LSELRAVANSAAEQGRQRSSDEACRHEHPRSVGLLFAVLPLPFQSWVAGQVHQQQNDGSSFHRFVRVPPQARKELKAVGWAKGLELAKLARRDGQHFDCATWLHRARTLPKDQFRQEVEKELTGKETEPWEIVYFKLYQSQIPVIEQALETAARMLGSDRSRGYCLEMICADFLAGANLDNGDPGTLLFSMTRFFRFLPEHQRQVFLKTLNKAAA
jgi:hypothetical protein